MQNPSSGISKSKKSVFYRMKLQNETADDSLGRPEQRNILQFNSEIQ